MGSSQRAFFGPARACILHAAERAAVDKGGRSAGATITPTRHDASKVIIFIITGRNDYHHDATAPSSVRPGLAERPSPLLVAPIERRVPS